MITTERRLYYPEFYADRDVVTSHIHAPVCMSAECYWIMSLAQNWSYQHQSSRLTISDWRGKGITKVTAVAKCEGNPTYLCLDTQYAGFLAVDTSNEATMDELATAYLGPVVQRYSSDQDAFAELVAIRPVVERFSPQDSHRILLSIQENNTDNPQEVRSLIKNYLKNPSYTFPQLLCELLHEANMVIDYDQMISNLQLYKEQFSNNVQF